MDSDIRHYGVLERSPGDTDTEIGAEAVRLLGYAVVNGGYADAELEQFRAAFDGARDELYRKFTLDRLERIDEHNTLRALLAFDPLFLKLARNPNVLEICTRLIGGQIVLNQQNGVINPPRAERYNQSSWHRDLPYQHFVSSRPLAVNALFCLDPFVEENGSTLVLPGSHRQEPFPSDATVRAQAARITAEAGSFIVMDGMMFHRGGRNLTGSPRRAVSNFYTSPMFRQQIDLRGVLGDGYSSDPEIRRFLGFNLSAIASLEAYYESRPGSRG